MTAHNQHNASNSKPGADSENLNGSSPALRDVTVSGEDRNAILVSLKDEFVSKYGISVLDNGGVRVKLPAGISRREFLEEAQEIAKPLYGVRFLCGYYISGTNPDLLTFGDKFTRKLSKQHDVEIHYIESKRAMYWSRMSDAEKTNVPYGDISVGHAAYYMATGKDYFARAPVFTMESPVFASHTKGLGRDGGLSVSCHSAKSLLYFPYYFARVRSEPMAK